MDLMASLWSQRLRRNGNGGVRCPEQQHRCIAWWSLVKRISGVYQFQQQIQQPTDADKKGRLLKKGRVLTKEKMLKMLKKTAAMARIWRMNLFNFQWMLHIFKLVSNAHYAGHVDFGLDNEEQLEETIISKRPKCNRMYHVSCLVSAKLATPNNTDKWRCMRCADVCMLYGPPTVIKGKKVPAARK
jgi:hypothetical protein